MPQLEDMVKSTFQDIIDTFSLFSYLQGDYADGQTKVFIDIYGFTYMKESYGGHLRSINIANPVREGGIVDTSLIDLQIIQGSGKTSLYYVYYITEGGEIFRNSKRYGDQKLDGYEALWVIGLARNAVKNAPEVVKNENLVLRSYDRTSFPCNPNFDFRMDFVAGHGVEGILAISCLLTALVIYKRNRRARRNRLRLEKATS